MKNFRELSMNELLEIADDSEKFEKILAFECIEHGVDLALEPKKSKRLLELETRIITEDMKTAVFYKIGELYFDNLESIKKIIELNPFISEYTWEVGYNYRYVVPLDTKSGERPVTEKFYPKELVDAHREVMKEYKDLNEKFKDAWEAWNKKKTERDGILKEINNLIDKAVRLNLAKTSVWDAYTRYVGLCDGDTKIAMRFLFKNFNGKDSMENRARWQVYRTVKDRNEEVCELDEETMATEAEFEITAEERGLEE